MSPKDLPLHVLFLEKQVLGSLIQAAKELFLPAPPTCSYGKHSQIKNHTCRLASPGRADSFPSALQTCLHSLPMKSALPGHKMFMALFKVITVVINF